MDMPAPDGRALLWKIEKLLALDHDGNTESSTTKGTEQTIADARRLLP
jgi:hypothetical protein